MPRVTSSARQKIARDVTRRKRMEVALRESEQRLHLATQTGKLGVWDWDIVTNRISWSDSLYVIHGLRPDQFDGTVEGFAALVHPRIKSWYQRRFSARWIAMSPTSWSSARSALTARSSGFLPAPRFSAMAAGRFGCLVPPWISLNASTQ